MALPSPWTQLLTSPGSSLTDTAWVTSDRIPGVPEALVDRSKSPSQVAGPWRVRLPLRFVTGRPAMRSLQASRKWREIPLCGLQSSEYDCPHVIRGSPGADCAPHSGSNHGESGEQVPWGSRHAALCPPLGRHVAPTASRISVRRREAAPPSETCGWRDDRGGAAPKAPQAGT